MRKTLTYITPILFLIILVYCGDQGVSPDRVNYVLPESELSYYKDLQPLFNGKCGFGSQCHSSENPNNGLFFGSKEGFITYIISRTGDQLVDPIVHREAPEFSPLYILITGQYSDYERQPPLSYGREPLNNNQINGIKEWIKEGVPD